MTVSAATRYHDRLKKKRQAMDVLKRLAAYLQENHPQQATAYAELLPVFGEELARAYG